MENPPKYKKKTEELNKKLV